MVGRYLELLRIRSYTEGSEGLEVELKLTFKSRLGGQIKNLIRHADSLDFTSEEAQGISDQDEDDEEIDF